LQVIKPVLCKEAKSFEIKADVTDSYNDWLQRRLSKSVWTDCNSYYQIGGSKQTKIVGTFPGPVALFWWLARKPRWDEYIGVGDQAWVERRKADRLKSLVFLGLTAIAIAGLAVSFIGDTAAASWLYRNFPAFSSKFV
jgi:hypothetical protein